MHRCADTIARKPHRQMISTLVIRGAAACTGHRNLRLFHLFIGWHAVLALYGCMFVWWFVISASACKINNRVPGLLQWEEYPAPDHLGVRFTTMAGAAVRILDLIGVYGLYLRLIQPSQVAPDDLDLSAASHAWRESAASRPEQQSNATGSGGFLLLPCFDVLSSTLINC